MQPFSGARILSILGELVNIPIGYKSQHSPLIRKIFQGYAELTASAWLNSVETISDKELIEYQIDRLRIIAGKACSMPFYRKIFEERHLTIDKLRFLNDLFNLPVVYKKDFRNYLEADYIDFNLGESRGYWVNTSGSTGEPFRLMRDKKYLTQVRSFNLRIFKWFGIDINSRKANFITPWSSSPSTWGNSNNDKYLTVDNFQDKVGEYADFLERFQPTILESNPSFMIYFAHYLNENKRKIHIPYLLSYGEQLFDEERKFLEEIFSGEVINRYGLTEITNIGVECPKHEGFHVNSLGCLVEIVDKKGNPIFDEKEGEIVLTSLINEVTPILRYGTGDRGRWIKKQCPCGRTYPLFQVKGRRDDFIVLPGNRIIYIHFFRDIFYKHLDKIRQFQVVQESKIKITIRLVPTEFFSLGDEMTIISKIKALIGKNTQVKMIKERYIPWDKKSGKYKALVRL